MHLLNLLLNWQRMPTKTHLPEACQHKSRWNLEEIVLHEKASGTCWSWRTGNCDCHKSLGISKPAQATELSPCQDCQGLKLAPSSVPLWLSLRSLVWVLFAARQHVFAWTRSLSPVLPAQFYALCQSPFGSRKLWSVLRKVCAAGTCWPFA